MGLISTNYESFGSQMNNRKIIKRALVGIILAVILFISTGIVFSIIYKDQIIGYFLNETNKHITTPVDVEKIEVSIFSQFPDISINLRNVTIKESGNDNQGILGKAQLISVSFNIIDIINKHYSIKGIHLYEADVMLKIDKQGVPNYIFYKKDTAAKGGMFSLQNITGENIKIDYLDQKSDYHVALIAKKINSRLRQIDHNLFVELKGSMVSDEIRVSDRIFLNNKLVDLETELEVDLKKKIYNFKTGGLHIDNGEFEVTGIIDVDERFLDLKVNGLNTNFQSINSLLSNDLAKHFENYRSKGNVYFSGDGKSVV